MAAAAAADGCSPLVGTMCIPYYLLVPVERLAAMDAVRGPACLATVWMLILRRVVPEVVPGWEAESVLQATI